MLSECMPFVQKQNCSLFAVPGLAQDLSLYDAFDDDDQPLSRK